MDALAPVLAYGAPSPVAAAPLLPSIVPASRMLMPGCSCWSECLDALAPALACGAPSPVLPAPLLPSIVPGSSMLMLD
ncbi:unnamed protein product [Aspergillus oryzae]|nr:unnamed protein product [Aspergillus oryzae]